MRTEVLSVWLFRGGSTRPGYLGAAATALAMGLFLGACASAPKPPPPRVDGKVAWVVRAADRINPDPSGESGPTLVKLLQLRSSARLERLTPEDAYQPARLKELLADDLLKLDEVTVFPGETVTKESGRELEASALAVIAVVRVPGAGDWRATWTPPPASEDPRVEFRTSLEGYRIGQIR